MALYEDAYNPELYTEEERKLGEQGILNAMVAGKSPEEIERIRLGLSAAGVVNPAADALEAGLAYNQGDYLGTALALGSMALPIPLAMVLGKGGRGAKAAGLLEKSLGDYRPRSGDITDAISMGREHGAKGLRDFYVPEVTDYDKAAYYSGEKPWLSYLHAQSPEMTPEGVYKSDLVKEMYSSLDDDVIASMRHKYHEAPELFEGVTMLDERTPMPFSHFYTDMGEAVGRTPMTGDEVAEAIAAGGLHPSDTSGLSWISGHPNFLEGVSGGGEHFMDPETGLQTMWGGGREVAGRYHDLAMKPSGTMFDPWYDPHAEKFLDTLKAKGGEASQAYADLNIIEAIDDGETARKYGHGVDDKHLIGIHNLDSSHEAKIASESTAFQDDIDALADSGDYYFDPVQSADDSEFQYLQDLMEGEEGVDDLLDEYDPALADSAAAGNLAESGQSVGNTLQDIIEGHRGIKHSGMKLGLSHELPDSFEPIQEIIEGKHKMSNEAIVFPQSWIQQTAQRINDPKFKANLSDEQIKIYERALSGEKITWKEFYSATHDGVRSLAKKFDNAKYSKVLADNDLQGTRNLGHAAPTEESVAEARKWCDKNPDQERLNPMYFGDPSNPNMKGRDQNYLIRKLFGHELYMEPEALQPGAIEGYDDFILGKLQEADSWKFQEQMYHNIADDFTGGIRQIEPGYTPWEHGPMGFENFAVPRSTVLKSASGVFNPMPGYAEDLGEFTGVESVRMPSRGRYGWKKGLDWSKPGLAALSMPGAGYLLHQMTRSDRGA